MRKINSQLEAVLASGARAAHHNGVHYWVRTTTMPILSAQRLAAGPQSSPCVRVRRMLDPKFFDDLAQRLHTALPEGARVLQQDVDRNLRAAVQAALNRLDLVTREEFEVQAKVLARTRAQLDGLNQRVARLEARLFGNTAPPSPSMDEQYGDDQDMNGG